MNDRERRFVAEYAVDCNAQAAARRAGLRTTNISSYLLHHKEVAAAVAKVEAERSARRRVTADRILEEYARIAFADMRDFVDWGPDSVTLRDKAKLSEWEGGAVARVEPPGNGKLGSIRLHDKHAALEALVRHTGLFDSYRALSRRDERRTGRDARNVLVERLKRLARGETEPPKS
ncbi:MAG TPA: terminase small subunit [Stellaceae bacterium]|nr:terminase small subunit [Stellaceae bacterium]